MRNLTATICLTIALLFGCTGVCKSADFQRGLTAARSGDYATALREWKPLAKQGDANAQFNLGVMYKKGQGVPQNNKTALKWYRLAAEQGNARAQSKLGLMYKTGKGVPQDYKTAVKWYRLAAEQGYALAQSNLGTMYYSGQGVLKNYVSAHMWFNLGSTSGKSKNASKNRDIIAKLMTPAQIADAQKLARECVRKKYKGC
jgi:TPR repeat protein